MMIQTLHELQPERLDHSKINHRFEERYFDHTTTWVFYFTCFLTYKINQIWDFKIKALPGG